MARKSKESEVAQLVRNSELFKFEVEFNYHRCIKFIVSDSYDTAMEHISQMKGYGGFMHAKLIETSKDIEYAFPKTKVELYHYLFSDKGEDLFVEAENPIEARKKAPEGAEFIKTLPNQHL